MITSQRFKLLTANVAIVVLSILLLRGFVSGFLNRWVGFLSVIPYAIEFISLFLIILIVDSISRKLLGLA
jgi:hypothetical protein